MQYNRVHYDVFEKEKVRLLGGSWVGVDGRVNFLQSDLGEILETVSDRVFAHCISKDFGDPKHMSEGVARMFADKLSKPVASDTRFPNLTIRTYGKDFAIGLLTNDKYFLKPGVTYGKAFSHPPNNLAFLSWKSFRGRILNVSRFCIFPQLVVFEIEFPLICF